MCIGVNTAITYVLPHRIMGIAALHVEGSAAAYSPVTDKRQHVITYIAVRFCYIQHVYACYTNRLRRHFCG
jgi:hypothetical protein